MTGLFNNGSRLLFLVICGLSLLSLAPDARPENLGAAVERDYEQHLKGLFKHFHENPELSFREYETAKRLAAELRSSGIEVTERIAGTGIVGVLKNGNGPLVLIRADMDGLPIKEQTNLSYASTAVQADLNGEIKPVMHACGHDVHITALIGAARQLVARKDEWQGSVMFVGQPAEEIGSGAKTMLEDGLYERFGVPDYVLGFHVDARAEAGKISIPMGAVTYSADSVDITVFGIGAHGAAPQYGKDPILIASQLVVALQSIVSRELSPMADAVISVGSIHGGTKHNIIPDEVKLQLTVRTGDEQVRQQILDRISTIANGIAHSAGLPEKLYPKIDILEHSVPVLINESQLAARMKTTIADEVGTNSFYDISRDIMVADDFAFFVQTDEKVPGLYFAVGGRNREDIKNGIPITPHHSPFFKIEPKPAITSGVRALVSGVIELLKLNHQQDS